MMNTPRGTQMARQAPSSSRRRSATSPLNVIMIDDGQEEGDYSPNAHRKNEAKLASDNKIHFSCEMVHKGGVDKDVPQSRQCHSAVYIDDREEMVIFGGRIRKTMYSDELFIYNARTRKWTAHRNPRNNQLPWPYGRKLASLLYDKNTNSLYAFGGLLPSEMSKTLNQQGITELMISADGDIRQTDLWKFNFTTCKWTCLSTKLPFTTPDEQHVLLQQSPDCLIVLGGQTMSHSLYRFNLITLEWEIISFEVVNKGKPVPDRLRLFSTVTRQNEMILFGGKHCDVQMMTNDLWSFNIQTYEWKKIVVDPKSAALCPRDRTMTALLQDDFLVVYGGRKNDGHLIGDVFMFSLIDKRWYLVEVDNLFPGKVFNAVSVPVYKGHGMLMFGGHDGAKSLNCVYEFKLPVLKAGPSMASLLSQDKVLCADIAFHIGQRELQCHSCIVSRVPHLRDLIKKEKTNDTMSNDDDDTQADTVPSSITNITLSGSAFTPKAFEQLLMFLYGKVPEITAADEVIDLGILASHLNMHDLFEWCVTAIKGLLTPNNVFSVITRSHSMMTSEFEDTCVAFIASNPELKQHEEIASLPKETLVKVLRSTTNVSSPQSVNVVDPSRAFQSYLRTLRSESVETSDLTIKTKDKDFFVHKVILVFQSEYFAKMFGGSFAEHSDNTIELTDISGSTMSLILDSLYNERIDFNLLSVHELMDIAKGANMLLLPKLEVSAINELCTRASTQNAFEMLHFSRLIPNRNGTMLKTKCLELVEKEDLVQHLFQFVDAHAEIERELTDLKRQHCEVVDRSADNNDIDFNDDDDDDDDEEEEEKDRYDRRRSKKRRLM